MPIVRFTVTCEECGTERKPTDKWFSTFRSQTGNIVISPLDMEQVEVYAKSDENLAYAKTTEYKIHCGESCLLHYISGNLSTLRKEEK